MTAELRLDLQADMAALKQADLAVSEMASRMGWSQHLLFHLRLVLEEVMMNVISYGSSGGRLVRIQVDLIQDAGALRLEISDDGVAFDPLSLPPPDLDLGLEERQVGGLGVYLVRTMMDSVSYRRDGDWNRLLMSKSLE